MRRMRSQILTFLQEQLRKEFSTISFTPYTGGLPKQIHASVGCPEEVLTLIQNSPRCYRSELETEILLVGADSLEGVLEDLFSWVEKHGFFHPEILNFEILRLESAQETLQGQKLCFGKISILFLTEGKSE